MIYRHEDDAPLQERCFMGSVHCCFCQTLCNAQSHQLITQFWCEVCGCYQLTHWSCEFLKSKKKIDNFFLHCIAETIQANKEGLIPFWQTEPSPSDNKSNYAPNVVLKYFNNYESLPISHTGKTELLLKIIAQKTYDTGPFNPVELTKSDMYSIKILDKEELKIWLQVLIQKQLIEEHVGLANNFSLTPYGWIEADRLFQRVHSNTAFIALDFKNAERPLIQEAVKDACKKTGWDAYTVDEKDFAGGITDQIIAEIKGARFVVAEFSHNNPGVYYEAGFAAGLGVPVIYVVKNTETDVKGLHFDTRHINHIRWDNYDDLKIKLINRIRAVIS